MRLPKRICALDIETESASFSSPEKSKLAFVGIIPYTFRNGGYFPEKHKCFLPHQMKELEGFLKTFPGIIIGHNIYDFDFRVLGDLISLRGIVDKTVDTLFLLSKRNRQIIDGLALGDLSRINLGEQKLIEGRSIPELWRQGRFKKVINYNKNDCHLTQKLWLRMVKKGRLNINYEYFPNWCFIYCHQCKKTYIGELTRGCKVFDRSRRGRRYNPTFNYPQLELSPSDLRFLTGQSPLLTFQEWKRRIDVRGSILERKRKLERSRKCAHCMEGLPRVVNPEVGKIVKYKLHGEFYGIHGSEAFRITKNLSERGFDLHIYGKQFL